MSRGKSRLPGTSAKPRKIEMRVAQLLVELPTKTIRLESSFATTRPGPAPIPVRRPFRLWTDMPMEERVHVQSVPGGDSGLFTGLSVFTPELWKYTGYVPKKFNFQYREFPCWDEEGSKNEEDQENAPDNYSNFSKFLRHSIAGFCLLMWLLLMWKCKGLGSWFYFWISWKNEHRLMCASEIYGAAKRDCYEKSRYLEVQEKQPLKLNNFSCFLKVLVILIGFSSMQQSSVVLPTTLVSFLSAYQDP